MAGDWLKMRHDLVDDPAVIALATLDGVADRQHAVGLLHKFWSWADRQSANGDVSVTQEFLDLFVGARGFCALLIEQGWLNVTDKGLTIPNYDRHMSKNAKRRAQTQKRMKRLRDAPKRTTASPEKRREEKSKKKPPTPLELVLPFPSEAFKAAWAEFDEHRRKLNKPWTTLAAKKILNRLKGYGHDGALESINYSIEGGYPGVYDRRGQTSGQPRSPARVVGKPGKYDGIAKSVQTGTFAPDVREAPSEVDAPQAEI